MVYYAVSYQIIMLLTNSYLGVGVGGVAQWLERRS